MGLNKSWIYWLGVWPCPHGSDFGLDASAVFIVDEFEEEEVEENDAEREHGPEDSRKASERIAVFVQRQDVILMSRS